MPIDLSEHAGTRKVRDWFLARGVAVKPGIHYALYDGDDGDFVTYRPQDRPETVLRGLLHEAGHVLIYEATRRGGTRFKRGWSSTRTQKARSRVSAADMAHEELEAWHRGFRLARRLGVRLDADAYWADYGACAMWYFRKFVARAV